MTNNTTICRMAYDYAYKPLNNYSQVHHIAGSFLGMVLLPYFMYYDSAIPRIFNKVTKTLLRLLMTSLFIHNFSYGFIVCYHVVIRLLRFGPCDLAIITWKCLLFRVPSNAGIFSLTVIYYLLLFDRFYEIFATQIQYEKFEQNANHIIYTLLVVLAGGGVIYIFYGEDLFAWKSYCMTSSPTNANKVFFSHMFLVFVDILCTMTFHILLLYMTNQLKNGKHDYQLAKKVEMRDKVAALRLLTSASLLRTIFVDSFFCISFLLVYLFPKASYVNPIYIIPWYGFALTCQLFFWRSFRVAHAKSDKCTIPFERKAHFEQLARQWK